MNTNNEVLSFLNTRGYKYWLFNDNDSSIIEIGIIGTSIISLMKNYKSYMISLDIKMMCSIEKSKLIFKMDNSVRIIIYIYYEFIPNILFSDSNKYFHIHMKEILFPQIVYIDNIPINKPAPYISSNRFSIGKISGNKKSPHILFLTLGIDKNNKVVLDIFDNTCKYFFIVNEENIIHNNKYLLSTKSDTKWNFIECNNLYYIQSNYNKKYISCDVNYELIMTKDISNACPFNISIHENYHILTYTKPKLAINMEINNLIMNHTFNHHMKQQKNIAILLASGYGKRYSQEEIKQLATLNNKPLIYYSIKVFNDNMNIDMIVICTNTRCYDIVNKIINLYNFSKVHIVIADNGDRTDTIMTAYNYIKNNINNVNNIIIHDTVRPLINEQYISTLLKYMNHYDYATYYLNLRNGLALKEFNSFFNMFEKSEYIEICTPICIKYNLFSFINDMYINVTPRLGTEYIPFLKILHKKIKLVEGDIRYIYKLTYKNDLKLLKIFYDANTSMLSKLLHKI